jgi:4-hydroxy-tetrahydrodipicolinate reductase
MIKVIQYGMGFLGQKVAQLMLTKGFNVVAAVAYEKNIGKDIGELIGLGRNIGVIVSNDALGTLKQVKADVVSLQTVSRLETLYNQIMPCIEAGLNVVTSCEELVYPWDEFPKLSKEIDICANSHNVTVVATGINPGFVMDFLPVVLASGCRHIDKVRVQRVVDFSIYGPSTRNLRRFGVTPSEFRSGWLRGNVVGHIGLHQSVAMVANALNWKLDNFLETWSLVISKSLRKAIYEGEVAYTVKPGTVAGWRQSAIGSFRGEAKIIMDMYCITNPMLEEDGVELGDTIWIDGNPSLTIKMKGPAEQGAAIAVARIVNVIPAVIKARPGLLSVKDLPATPPLPDRF